MTQPLNPVARLSDLALEPFSEGAHYEGLDRSFGRDIGLEKIGAAYTIVRPGKSACPFHSHHAEDEMFVILEGEGTYRFGAASYAVKAGDVLGAPTGGAEHAHKITNTGTVPLKYLSISSMAAVEVCEYPDSGKFLASVRHPITRAQHFRHVGRPESEVDYWDGEDSAD